MRGATATRSLQGTEPYLASFAQLESGRDGQRHDGRSYIHEIRRAAMDRFAEVGFPTTRDEEWRFTNVAPITRIPFRLPGSFREDGFARDQITALAALLFGENPSNLMVFWDGVFIDSLSSRRSVPDGVVMGSLSTAIRTCPELVEPHLTRYAGFKDSPFTALNTAFLEDGAFIHLGRGRVVEDPIRMLFVSTAGGDPVVSHPRTLVVAGENSQATVVEAYGSLGSNTCFTNAVTEIAAHDGAVLDHYKVQQDSDRSFHVASLNAALSRSSQFSSHSFSLGGGLVRNDVRAMLNGEGIECTLNGLYLGTRQQVVDNHTSIDHAMPHCNSHEVYHGVLAGKATGVFNGKIFVRQDAQKTDAKQTNRTLLLSDDAVIDTKPQLEIFADDVRCTHGATVGHLDEDALFYLRTRGIPRAEAGNLLTYAFANEIVERVKVKPLQDGLEKLIFEWLRAQGVEEAA